MKLDYDYFPTSLCPRNAKLDETAGETDVESFPVARSTLSIKGQTGPSSCLKGPTPSQVSGLSLDWMGKHAFGKAAPLRARTNVIERFPCTEETYRICYVELPMIIWLRMELQLPTGYTTFIPYTPPRCQ